MSDEEHDDPIDAMATVINAVFIYVVRCLIVAGCSEAKAHEMVNDVRRVKGKQKVIVFQPFGSTAGQMGSFISDSSGRSFELSDSIKLIDELKNDYGLVLTDQALTYKQLRKRRL